MEEYTILEQVKIRLKQFHVDDSSGEDVVVFDHKEENPFLQQLINQAKDEVAKRRMYPNRYTEKEIASDLEKFSSNIVNIVVYDRSQAGEEYMSSYSENGVNRTWKNREELFSGIYPFVKIL